ncbi:hypothetical protein C8A03DRAFT_17879 [Achaetomium macrosporum]|uniref:Uncharacterized protein n=1 Tax=Achaetomium macrosporum TaxID=79813 RepID=A0AAN7H8P2_9PEZI|nr:hypothetical protein C8A03DRAFT_17879 [Achaetomium macrosporum]
MAVQQVIHLRYNDLGALNEELTRLFGEGNCGVEFEMGQIILTLPRALVESEILRIQSKRRHYRSRSDRRR